MERWRLLCLDGGGVRRLYVRNRRLMMAAVYPTSVSCIREETTYTSTVVLSYSSGRIGNEMQTKAQATRGPTRGNQQPSPESQRDWSTDYHGSSCLQRWLPQAARKKKSHCHSRDPQPREQATQKKKYRTKNRFAPFDNLM